MATEMTDEYADRSSGLNKAIDIDVEVLTHGIESEAIPLNYALKLERVREALWRRDRPMKGKM